jgi:hypothetical protein
MDDENIIIVGYKQDSSGNKNAIIIKYDLDGNLVWNYDFGGGGTDRFNDVIYTGDGYIAVGDSSSNDGNMLGLSIGGTDAIIVKYNLDGSILSKKVVGGNNTDQFSSIELTVDDKFLLIGNSDSTNGDIQGLTTKGNNDGIMFYYEPDATDTSKLNLVWKKNFGGSNTDNFSQIIILPDGYYVIGYTNSTDGDCSNLGTGILGGNSGIILLRYSSNGSLIWKKLIGAGQSYNYFRGSVYDNRLIIAGNFNSYDNGDAIIMGFDEGE